MPRRLPQSKDLGVRRWIRFSDALVEPSPDYFPSQDNHGPDWDLLKLKCPSCLREGF
jgi:hypothetical protein